MKTRKVLPPAYFFVLLAVSIVAGIYLPIMKVVSSPYRYAGALPIAIGVVLNVWADSVFRKKKTTVKPHEKPSVLVTFGPFRVSRNPMYLGMVAILFGVSACVGSLSAFVSPLLFFLVAQYRFIPLEEGVMESAFGERYLEYKKRVRPWI